MERLPHRPPFLLIEGVIECEPGLRARGWKCISYSDVGVCGADLVSGFPSVLMLECMAQMAAIALWVPDGDGARLGSDMRLASISNAHFNGWALPGDKLMVETRVVKRFDKLVMARGQATLNGAVLSVADLVLSSGAAGP